LIVIAGQIGAGKSTAAKYLESAFGVRHMSFVDLIWKPILAARGLPATRRNLQLLGIELMRDIGPEGLADQLLEMCVNDSWATVDDVRTPSVHDRIVKRAPRSALLFLETPFESRFPRLVVRDSVKDEHEQREAEAFPTETEIDLLRPYARWVVRNDGDEAALHYALDQVAAELGIARGSNA
jgi:dephospho-CoA kinase